MPSQNNNKLTSFTATYLRLLTGETPAPADWEAAAELIEAGFATGRVHRESTTGQRRIDALVGFAPTLQGRLYAQQLQEQAKARSTLGRMRKWIWVLAGALGGVFAESVAGLLTEAMKRALGW
jgi:hypothetical protein